MRHFHLSAFFFFFFYFFILCSIVLIFNFITLYIYIYIFSKKNIGHTMMINMILKLWLILFLYRIVVFLFIFSVFIAIINQAFSIMNILKASFHNIIKDDFIMEYLILYIKREIIVTFSPESIINDCCN